MTKKDYELIARIFNKNIHDTHPKNVRLNVKMVAGAMAQQFADVLAKDNPRFDAEKFLTACGIEEV